jgi:hypothetical protein
LIELWQKDRPMTANDMSNDYLSGLSTAHRRALAEINDAGYAALQQYLAAGDAVALLGAQTSVPLYPLPDDLVSQLIRTAADSLGHEPTDARRMLATGRPGEAAASLRQSLGVSAYREALREALQARADPSSGRSWTQLQELVCRCRVKGVVTTCFDSGIVNARMRVRPQARATGFATWQDRSGLRQWLTGRVFADPELPVLYAHGHHNRPDTVLLTTAEYEHAYEGLLAQVLASLASSQHLVWIGFDFGGRELSALSSHVGSFSPAGPDGGTGAGHLMVMPWDPATATVDPQALAQIAESRYNARILLYPAPTGDHSALVQLLAAMTDASFAASFAAAEVAETAALPEPDTDFAPRRKVPVAWEPRPEGAQHFTGRTEELTRLNGWAADPDVALIAATGWGGAGKTALVTHWLLQADWASRRTDIRGVFCWSFYAYPDAKHWAMTLLRWAERECGISITRDELAEAVLALLEAVPLLLMLDGLEVLQEDAASGTFGRLLDGILREVLTKACQVPSRGLIVLTSRFPFADLEAFDGGSARTLDVPAFTPAEGSALLAEAGGGWLAEEMRQSLVSAMDGHALAVGVLAAALAVRSSRREVSKLRSSLNCAANTSARVGLVLDFYARQLSEPDRYLLAAISLFARPVSATAILAVARHRQFGGHLDGWTPHMVIAEARDRLGGLVSVNPDWTLSAHPLIRASFRPLALGAAETAAEVVLAGRPDTKVSDREQLRKVIEVLELLIDADQWADADQLYVRRTDTGAVFKELPAASLGQRAARAFAGTASRREDCAAQLSFSDRAFYINSVGFHAMHGGDMETAREYLALAVSHDRNEHRTKSFCISLTNLLECYLLLGEIDLAEDALAEIGAYAERSYDWELRCDFHVQRGELAALTGDHAQADADFMAADKIFLVNDRCRCHMIATQGVLWADWLRRTGRSAVAWELANHNRQFSAGKGSNEVVARCDLVLARLSIMNGDAETGHERLASAARAFRAGDYLTDLAAALADSAECARLMGVLDSAERYASEAIVIAAARGLVAAESTAMAAVARIEADRGVTANMPDHLAAGRAAADIALQLAARHRLAWCELDALRAHAYLDQLAGTNSGWLTRADSLHARLVPQGLEADPLRAVERELA